MQAGVRPDTLAGRSHGGSAREARAADPAGREEGRSRPRECVDPGVGHLHRADLAAEADKRAFWAYTFQALAATEAGLQPTADVHHTEAAVDRVDPATHRLARQEGLLQLKYQDAQRYGCDFDYEGDSRLPGKSPQRTILQPERNLACGLKIMDNQIMTQGKPLVSRTSYWSTLQPGTASYRVFAKQMVNVPEACGLPRGGARHKRGRAGRELARR